MDSSVSIRFLITPVRALSSGSKISSLEFCAIAGESSSSMASEFSRSASVSGVGVRWLDVDDDAVFDSESSVSVGCSDSVSGVFALDPSF